MAVTTNLYPPIVDTYMPAFLINSENENNNICKVYFSLSLFNTADQIKNVQINIRNNSTNLSALNSEKYPSEVMITTLKEDLNATTDTKYYIEIKPEDMENENFIVDQYYKVQIRFTSLSAEDVSLEIPQAIDKWLADNINYFSEWSTICLIRGISIPTLAIQDFNEDTPTDIYATIANTRVIGTLNFSNEDETETLKNYRIKLYDSNDKLLLDSGDIYTSKYTDVNSINYTINYDVLADESYYFTVEYTTQNLWTEIHTYHFNVLQAELPDLNIQVNAYLDEDNGRIGIRVTRSRAKGRYTGKMIIRRASSKNNFTTWEDMYITSYQNVPYIQYTWYDYTIESGVFYLYAIQGADVNGARTPMSKFKKPIMVILDDIFLTSGNKQLKIRLNPTVQSYKRTVSESRVETIGSQYPIIKRNGYVDYAQFPLSGLIASAMDEDGLFFDKEEAYEDALQNYIEYNEDNEIYDYRDFVWEKTFREKVMDFLYDGEVKLYRSPTEGNLLVRLMDINLQPNQTLGRRLWTFSATAYEIDKNTIENLEYYNIFDRQPKTIVETKNTKGD